MALADEEAAKQNISVGRFSENEAKISAAATQVTGH